MFRNLNILGLAFGIASLAYLSLINPRAARPPLSVLPVNIMTSKTLTICSAINRPPMEFFNSDQRPIGLDIDLSNVLASRLGLKAKFVNVPFSGLIPTLLARHCDAIMAQLFITPSRLKVIDEIPYMYSQVGFILRAGSPKLNSLDDLSGKKVATITGTTSMNMLIKLNIKLIASNRAAINIIQLPENTTALQQVQFGQVYGYAVAYETGLYYSHLDPNKFELGGPPYFKNLSGIGVNKTLPGLEFIITNTLNDIVQDGSYASIFKKWNLSDDMLIQ